MSDALLWLSMAAAIVVALVAEFLASRVIRRAANRDDFDGGFRHDNEPVRVTRIRAPFIVTGERE